jgi:hypothetical protein
MTTKALLHARQIDTSIRGAALAAAGFPLNSLNSLERERGTHPHSHYHRLTLQQHIVAARSFSLSIIFYLLPGRLS